MNEVFNYLGNAADYARELVGKGTSVWLEVTTDGIRVKGFTKQSRVEKYVPWIFLKYYRNGAQSLLEITIDEVFAMLIESKEII